MKKVCLIELYNMHHECLYSQLLYLRSSGYEVSLVCDFRNANQTDRFSELTRQIRYDDFRKIKSLFRLRRFLIKEGFDTVIFNTAQSSRVARLLLLPFPRRISFIGTIHNLRKLTDSFDQRIIFRKIKRFYLLAEYLLPTFISLSGKRDLRAQPYSSSIFPPVKLQTLEKTTGECWIVVPGSIEYKRRDYEFLLDLAGNSALSPSVRFVLLGNATRSEGPSFIQKVKDLKLSEHFVWFEDFVPEETFQAYIQVADYLLPLIHGEKALEDYSLYKVSGTFVLAEAFGKILLCPEHFSKVPNFQYKAIYYKNIDHLIELTKVLQPDQITSKIDMNKAREQYISFLS